MEKRDEVGPFNSEFQLASSPGPVLPPMLLYDLEKQKADLERKRDLSVPTNLVSSPESIYHAADIREEVAAGHSGVRNKFRIGSGLGLKDS